MSTHVSISLPVADLARSSAFFEALGYRLNPQFTGDGVACVAVSEAASVMLLTHERWRGFTPKAICDTATAAEVQICLSCESRQQVDDRVAAAVAAGGAADGPADDYGFMYQRGFTDPDGHAWALVHMAAAPPS